MSWRNNVNNKLISFESIPYCDRRKDRQLSTANIVLMQVMKGRSKPRKP